MVKPAYQHQNSPRQAIDAPHTAVKCCERRCESTFTSSMRPKHAAARIQHRTQGDRIACYNVQHYCTVIDIAI